jgi:hypothetical protein
LLDIFFDPEDGGDMFLRNVGWNWTDYKASYPRRWYSLWMSLFSIYFRHLSPLAERTPNVPRYKQHTVPLTLVKKSVCPSVLHSFPRRSTYFGPV